MDWTIRENRTKKIKKSGRFSISAKLTLISTALSLVFLSAIIASATWLTNVRAIAREHTKTMNDWTALAVESELESIHSGAVSLLRKIGWADGVEAETGADAGGRLGIAARFFTLYPTIKAVCIFPAISQTQRPVQAMVEASDDALEPRLFVNNTVETIGHDQVARWFENQKETARRTLSDGILTRNAASFFDAPLLVMFFPYKNGAETTAAAVFFSPENLVKSLGAGVSAAYMINEAGDVALHAEEGCVPDDLSFIQWQTQKREIRSFTLAYSDGEGKERFAAIKKIAVNQREAKNDNNLVVITTFKTAPVFEKIAAVVRLLCFIGGGTLVLSLILVRLYAKTISKPLVALTQAANSIKKGDYAVNLAIRSRDEIGDLTQSLISMTHAAAYVEKFANKAALRLARQGTPVYAGRISATVCFVKFRAFAELTEHTSARDTAALANEFFSCLTPCIARAGGVVDTFLTHDGAALLAFWSDFEAGDPEWNAMNCIHAALMMRASVQKLNQERSLRVRVQAAQRKTPQPKETATAQSEFASCIAMNCVVTTGESLIGVVSVDGRKDLLIAGDTMTLAERIVDANEDFDTDILIMEPTRELIGERLVLEEMPVIEVKGRETPLRTFALVNIRDNDESDAILQEMEGLPCMETARVWVGVAGPQTMAGVRKRWLITV
ncbi:MAG: adenylate/guanylate cyclase domain-containing protein [Treponema sp.]|jgi:adenylate cyclase|nr:adenylate/guanylate cyclase domain-containing protein [Treponema sp.]